jgi:methyltransferase family protein
MSVSELRGQLERRTRDLIAKRARRHGYQLNRTPNVAPGNGDAADATFELVPVGRREPFSTAEYDVLPKGQFDTVPRNYYSPIPDLSLLPADIWDRRSEALGVELGQELGMDLLEQRLARYVAEMDVPVEGPAEPGVFFLNNSGFESVDAEVLYAMIREFRPRRVVELGSGYSTLLINMAIHRNAEEGAVTRHTAYDPYPREHVLGTNTPLPTELDATPATEVPVAVFDELDAGDVLFVDTTHTVKLGSDVNLIILDVLPRLRPGVLVHFHDIFLPWEYPRTWFEKLQYYWAEQYLLQAFLAFNRAFEVVFPAHAASRAFPERLADVVPSFETGVKPGSFWIRRSAGEAPR